MSAVVAKAPLYAVMIRAIRSGDGDFTVLDGNGVGAQIAFNRKFLVLAQVYCFIVLAVQPDLCLGGGFSGGEEPNTQPGTGQKHHGKDNHPQL